MATDINHAALMDRVYRFQRRFGFYDATRKYYLIGRDPMIAGLRPPAGSTVLEVGCGTGRNIVKAATLYPDVTFHGIDISREMLAASASTVARFGLEKRVRLAWADAAGFDPRATFAHESYERIFMSYAVSMIPQWRAVMRAAAERLSPGGEMHIADFGDMAALPGLSRTAMYTWLHWYHVTPRADLFETADVIAREIGGTSEAIRLHRGFSWISIVRRP